METCAVDWPHTAHRQFVLRKDRERLMEGSSRTNPEQSRGAGGETFGKGEQSRGHVLLSKKVTNDAVRLTASKLKHG